MIIAAAGLTGVGKTTALKFLETAGLGRIVYAGAYVRSEVEKRGLPVNSASEKQVRDEMRRTDGMSAVAKMALAEIRLVPENQNILIDAIYNHEERDLYIQEFGEDVHVLGLRAPLEMRIERLSRRSDRPISKIDIQNRDRYEIEQLRVNEVVEAAFIRLDNVGTLEDLELTLSKRFRYPLR